MTMQETLENKIKTAISPDYFAIENESYMHNVPSGSESHFKITVVSQKFTDLPLIKRHQLIYGIIKGEMKQIHALALHTLTNEEFAKRKGAVPNSPQCHGGSK